MFNSFLRYVICISIITLFSTSSMAASFIMGYWGNWHVWDADKNGRSMDEYQIPGSHNKETGAIVVNSVFQQQLKYLNAVSYAFLDVYPDAGMNSDLPQKTVDDSKRGTVFFSDPWTDLLNDVNTTQTNIKFCKEHYITCFFPFEISTHWNPNPKPVDIEQPWNYFSMGNFDAFTHLKNVKRIISIGGWFHEKSFEEGAFKNPQNFSSSIIAIIKKAKEQGGDIDGVDFDYEPPTGYTAENGAKLAALAKQLRQDLDKNNLRNVIITAAVFANKEKIEAFGKENWKTMASVMEYIGLMGYDFHGKWDSPSITGLQSNLSADPTNPNKEDFSDEKAVAALKAAGVPENKMVLGIPSYGRVVGGVGSANNGLYQSFDPNVLINEDLGNDQVSYYKIIGKWLGQGYTDYNALLNGKPIGTWAYNSSNKQFVSYDNISVISTKADYVLKNHLGGMMMWELLGDVSPDDKNNASLLKQMSKSLN